MNIKQISATLAEIVEKHGLTALEISRGRNAHPHRARARAGRCGSLPAVPAAPRLPRRSGPRPPPSRCSEDASVDFNAAKMVKSPDGGRVLCRALAPDASPLSTVGSKVKKGDVLCIIEAMKLMNEITAELDGEVVDICVHNGERGRIRPDRSLSSAERQEAP